MATDRAAVRIRDRPWGERLERLLRYRLVIPLKRSRHPPEYSAHGLMVGAMVAFTPTVGVQMAVVVVIWLIARHLFNWHFSVILGCAITWVTNYITAPPIYYLFYVTGQLLLGRLDDLTGYHAFVELARSLFAPPDLGVLELARYYTTTIVVGWGMPMLIGCVPYAVVAGAVSFWWGLRFIVRYRRASERRKRRRTGDQARVAARDP